jgi:hypothetical protein
MLSFRRSAAEALQRQQESVAAAPAPDADADSKAIEPTGCGSFAAWCLSSRPRPPVLAGGRRPAAVDTSGPASEMPQAVATGPVAMAELAVGVSGAGASGQLSPCPLPLTEEQRDHHERLNVEGGT